MIKSKSGFTIVELLIVIVVIAILAAISIVAYNGIQGRGRVAASVSEMKAWQKHFEIYRGYEGNYPSMANGDYCLGVGFPIGGGGVERCENYAGTSTDSPTVSSSAPLMTELLSKVGPVPSGTRTIVSGTVGPYARYETTLVRLLSVNPDSYSSTCPDGMTLYVLASGGRLICQIILTK